MHSMSMSALLALATAAPQAPQAASADAVSRWNAAVTQATEKLDDPLAESRVFSVVHAAIHDALNAIEPRYESYGEASLPPARGASVEAAIAAAARDAFAALMPDLKAPVEQAYSVALASLGEGDAVARGLETGRRAAAALLALRANDGASRSVDVPAGVRPGEYRPTPPDFTPAFKTQWGGVTPFVLESAAQFRPEPPLPLDSARARHELEQVRRIGAQTGSERSAEHSEISRFWYEGSTQGWNRIARVLAEQEELDPWESARFFALVNLAMADGFIAGFEAKYHYRFWRPVTALRAAGHAEWLSDLWTPPVPDHPSTHTVLGAAAATVMERYFGTDFIPFSMTSGIPYAGITREFWSFSQAARENGASRVLAGLHFPEAVRAGYELGDGVGTWVFEHALAPLEKAAVAASSGAAR